MGHDINDGIDENGEPIDDIAEDVEFGILIIFVNLKKKDFVDLRSIDGELRYDLQFRFYVFLKEKKNKDTTYIAQKTYSLLNGSTFC